MNANMGELNTKLTNVNEQISANKEELKSDLKGIGDKLTTMDKKFEEMEGRIESVEHKIRKQILADANQWDSQTKACQLAASRADAADILQTLPETQRLDFDALVNALELRFGEKCVKDYSRLQLKSRQQKVSETLQELATDVERLSHVAFSDCPTEPSPATRKDRHPIRAVNESDTSNSSVERLERQMRSFMNRVESLMSQKADGKKTLKCWTCGREGHLQRSCRARQGAETNSASRKEVSEKLINMAISGRRLPDFGKPHFQV
ncbi:CCHC-type domain-containing protein [Trichonephila clavipes]|nr:CCHC-type domain-containing protein [Trichonephila clavipes]